MMKVALVLATLVVMASASPFLFGGKRGGGGGGSSYGPPKTPSKPSYGAPNGGGKNPLKGLFDLKRKFEKFN